MKRDGYSKHTHSLTHIHRHGLAHPPSHPFTSKIWTRHLNRPTQKPPGTSGNYATLSVSGRSGAARQGLRQRPRACFSWSWLYERVYTYLQVEKVFGCTLDSTHHLSCAQQTATNKMLRFEDKINKSTCCLTSTETVRLIRDGEKGGKGDMEVGEEGDCSKHSA